MSDIYGQLIEHPEFPPDDSRRFTVQIRTHDYESPPKRKAYSGGSAWWVQDEFCTRCGFHKITAIHPKEIE